MTLMILIQRVEGTYTYGRSTWELDDTYDSYLESGSTQREGGNLMTLMILIQRVEVLRGKVGT